MAYIYDGTSRFNATTYVENNQTAAVGAPYRAPISSKLIVVIMTAPKGNAGSARFSYKAYNVEEYAWFFKPFLGKESWMWFATIIGIAVFPIIIACNCFLCCRYSKCCQKHFKCCICSDCCKTDSYKEREEKLKSI